MAWMVRATASTPGGKQPCVGSAGPFSKRKLGPFLENLYPCVHDLYGAPMQAQGIGSSADERMWTGARCPIGHNHTLSESMWDLRWSDLLPMSLTDDGVIVEMSGYEEITPFIEENFAAMFKANPAAFQFLPRAATTARAIYYNQCADAFTFKHHGRIVGALVCNPSDWSSYYIRFCAFLPHYQGRQLLQRFFPAFFDALRVRGIERIETETSPSNLAVMHIMNRFRFNVTGTILSERWGALIRFTKFLDEKSEEEFLRQYCAGIR